MWRRGLVRGTGRARLPCCCQIAAAATREKKSRPRGAHAHASPPRTCRYYARMTMDFQTNKRVCEEVAIIPSKALKNKIAGYATHLMKRIQRARRGDARTTRRAGAAR